MEVAMLIEHLAIHGADQTLRQTQKISSFKLSSSSIWTFQVVLTF